MIEPLIAALRAADTRLDWRDLADALWLAIHSPEGDTRTQPPTTPAFPDTTPEIASTTTVSEDDYVELPGQLRLARALRPLRHRRRSNRTDPSNGVLDIGRTVEHFCETDVLIPVPAPPDERWFREAAVVMDDGPTMIVWRETVAAFTRMLFREGAFDRVTRWRLRYEAGPPVLLDHRGSAYPIDQLVERGGRQLIFLVSDCVSEIWRDATTAWDVLEKWGRFGPVVLVQTMPWHLWHATPLGSGVVTLFGQHRGNPNHLLRIHVPLSDGEDHITAVGTPVVGLDESMLDEWARMLMACGRSGIPGVVAPPRDDYEPEPGAPDHTTHELVRTFSGTASRPATQLAQLLSAVDVDLSIARLILRTLIPEGRQGHLAEVLASGLLRRPVPGAPEHFDFVPGAREVLHESLDRATALNVWRTISLHSGRTGGHGIFSTVLDQSMPPYSAMEAIASALAKKLDIPPLTQRVRVMGDQHDGGWWFCGRHAALGAITNWLELPERDRTLLVVTGDPGSGKSAVLGLIASLTHADYRAVAFTLGLPAEMIPPVGAVDVEISARHRTADQIRDSIAAEAGLTAATVDDLVQQLTGRTEVLTVLIDAVDESRDPNVLIAELLRPLTEHTDGHVRVVVGTRRNLLSDLGGYYDTIDLDSAQYADPTALVAHAELRLRGSAAHYVELDSHLVTAIATAVAEKAERSFLVARIVADALSADHVIPDPENPSWRHDLPKVPGLAMANDLRSRLGDQADRARDLLRPLAFAEGQGLPDKELWAPLASRIAEVEYTDDDLIWLLRTAGSYVIESTEAGNSAYRLHHQALAEYLAADLDDRVVHAYFVQVLRQRVPMVADGSRDWLRAHPYTVSHLASHAAHAELIDELVTDVDYLVHAEPTPLLAALNAVTTDTARLISTIYRCSASHHRRMQPAGRRQILAIDAARFQAKQLQEQLNRSLDWPARWATGSLTHAAHRATFTGHAGAVTGVACARIEGRSLAVTSGHDRTVRMWDMRTGVEQALLTGHTDWVSAVACTDLDGHAVAVTTGYDLTVRVWDLYSGTERAVLTGHTDWVSAVACTQINGRAVALTTGRDRTVRVWDLHSGTERAILTGHTDWVSAVACTQINGRAVALTTGRDRTVRVWDLHSGTERAILTGHTDWVSAVACTCIGDETVAVTTSYDRTVRVWNLRDGTERAVLTGHTNTVTAVTCTEIGDETVAVTTSYDRTVRVWDLGSGTERAELTSHTNWVSAVACTDIDNHPVALTTGWDSTLRLWELDASRHERHASGHADRVIAAAAHSLSDSTIAVTTGRDTEVRIWDLRTGTPLAVLTGHTRWVSGVACIDVDGHPVAVTTSRDNTVRVWDLRTATEHAMYTGHGHWVSAVACIDVDGHPVAVTTSRDATVRVWDLATGSQRDVLLGHTNPVDAVACTTVDGHPVAVTTGDDRTVRVWDLRTGTQRRILTGHTDSVNSVACTSIDNVPVAVTAGIDRTVRVWDLRTGTQRRILTGHTDSVNSVACTSIDNVPIVITAGHDRTVRIWNLDTTDSPTVIDCPTTQPLVAIGPDNEIILGLGNDIAVLTRRP
ncbi:hypothetical protein GFY24_19535 [Nocardia sp. SYP-A9097]|uniref:SAV_2336 N-terminal domain-related protein n=1 Tax=Nocardia sp. SYP-A9097 TaxID=2663237 RepID=UPI00129A9CA7|nr:SAV_2336 N-terminal domain-related protein [Nocardia sp. SYP-A9097]MRH89609.1 hypothetical protein [Nocardia sp. SYP-A9097]